MTRDVVVLGIDPGTISLGYGAIDVSPPRLTYIEAGVISEPTKVPRRQRIALIGRQLAEVMQALRPGAIAIEDGFTGKGRIADEALSEMRGGIITLADLTLEMAVSGYAPSTIKKAVTGTGSASKELVARVVKRLLGMKREPSPDAADALAIAICHARRMRLSEPAVLQEVSDAARAE